MARRPQIRDGEWVYPEEGEGKEAMTRLDQMTMISSCDVCGAPFASRRAAPKGKVWLPRACSVLCEAILASTRTTASGGGSAGYSAEGSNSFDNAVKVREA